MDIKKPVAGGNQLYALIPIIYIMGGIKFEHYISKSKRIYIS